MLTYKKLKLYKKYDGDGDAWVRRSWWWERNKMSADEWALIGQLISELKLINNGLAAASFAEAVETKISENCDDNETIVKLKELSRVMK